MRKQGENGSATGSLVLDRLIETSTQESQSMLYLGLCTPPKMREMLKEQIEEILQPFFEGETDENHPTIPTTLVGAQMLG